MSTTAKEVRAFVDRIERLHAERDALASDLRDLYTEAKAKNLDVKALKAVVVYRRKDRTEVEDLAARTAEYLAMMEGGTISATRAPARDPIECAPGVPQSLPVNAPEAAPKPPGGAASPIPDGVPDFLRREAVA